MFKITGAQAGARPTAGYVIAAAPKGRWRERWGCEDWFAPQVGGITHMQTAAYLAEHHGFWSVQAAQSLGVIRSVPAEVTFVTIAVAPFRMWERSGGKKRCSVRCAQVVLGPGPQLAAPGDISGVYDAQAYLKAAASGHLLQPDTVD
ncbi:MAG: hypothetical protein WAU75_05380 [Solirubrobacteraceae bacterium]